MTDLYPKKEDIVYKTINGTDLHLDLIFPKQISKPCPCAVFIHGGGWFIGARKDVWGFPLIIDALIEQGIIVASVEYRLVHKNGGGFPQSVEDTLDALQFIDRDIPEIDPQRKAVWGISAGGYMALMCALYQDPNRTPSPIKAILDMCGPTYLKGNDPRFPQSDMPQETQGYIRDLIGEYPDSPNYNPICLLHAAPQKPALMIVHGQLDECVPTEQSRQLYVQAQKEGFFAQYLEVEHGGHIFHSRDGQPIRPKTQDLMHQMSSFLITHLTSSTID